APAAGRRRLPSRPARRSSDPELAAFARASAPLRRGSLVRFRPRLGDYTHSATPGMLARLTKPYTPGDRYVYVEWQDGTTQHPGGDRKSTRLNSSHVKTSYAVL